MTPLSQRQSVTLSEGFQYQITSAPLSVATLDGDLHQSEKASLRNFVIQKSNATINEIQQKASWLIDGLVAV